MTDNCPKFGGEMRPGQAIAQTFTCSSDFYFDLGVTHSPGGPGRLIACVKCRKCWHSRHYGDAERVYEAMT